MLLILCHLWKLLLIVTTEVLEIICFPFKYMQDEYLLIRGDINIHNRWLQPKCCSIQLVCIAFPI